MTKLKIPYISQHINQVKADCGAACIAMLASTDLDDVIGTAALLNITMPLSFQEAYKLLAYYGLGHHYLAGLTVEQVKHHLEQGRPSILLANYRPVPNRQSTFTGAHWFLAVGYDETGVFVHDPNWWGQRVKEGEYLCLGDELLRGMMADPSGGDPEWKAWPFQGIIIHDVYPFWESTKEEPAEDSATTIKRLMAELETQTARADKAVATLDRIGVLLRGYEA